ncbi:MAG: hypothetical protein CM15mP85_24890 [Rhodobacterales bacterium]|nr:MAG: hypothetical protein CM15mP85_24890 [Rhodobacterales bacterium]
MGDPNASIPTLNRFTPINVWGFGRALSESSVTFVSEAAHADGISSKLGLAKKAVPVKNTRNIGKFDLKLNVAFPKNDVDPKPMKFGGWRAFNLSPPDEVPWRSAILFFRKNIFLVKSF